LREKVLFIMSNPDRFIGRKKESGQLSFF